MYDHKGVSTNNNAEGYNSKLGAKKQLSKHPNPYTLVEEIKNQLSGTSDTVVAETTNNKKRRVNKNSETLREARKGLMKDLSKRNIELESYMVQIGAKTLKYQPRVMNDPDPDLLGLGEIRCMREGEEMILFLMMIHLIKVFLHSHALQSLGNKLLHQGHVLQN